MIQTKLFLKLWTKINQSVIYLTNILSTFMKLYSELLTDKTVLILYETWYEVSYLYLKILRMIKMKTVVHKKESELKKVKKFLEWDKKIILIKYRDWLIY